jgi:hypothetical protein
MTLAAAAVAMLYAPVASRESAPERSDVTIGEVSAVLSLAAATLTLVTVGLAQL